MIDTNLTISDLLHGLKDCPFCGANFQKLELWDVMESESNTYPPPDDEDGYRITCKACKTQGPRRMDELDAIQAWNNRPPAKDSQG